MGVLISGGSPTAGFFFMGNPEFFKWMMTGGTPIVGNPHMEILHSYATISYLRETLEGKPNSGE